jgi:hypothetical protein
MLYTPYIPPYPVTLWVPYLALIPLGRRHEEFRRRVKTQGALPAKTPLAAICVGI